MLKKDVFFLFPPGYCGNYLQWIINVSEKNRCDSVIKDPLLPDTTTHGFVRRPTHLGMLRLLTWLSRNAAQDKQTFIVNCFTRGQEWVMNAAWAASMIMRARIDPRCINISVSDPDETIVGALNCYTKWPVYFLADSVGKPRDFFDFDPWGAAAGAEISLKDRNWLYDHWDQRFPINPSFDFDEFQIQVENYNQWYTIRNQLHSWEVNQTEFAVFEHVPVCAVHDIRLHDILQDNFLDRCFIPWIESQDIGEWQWDHARNYHAKYIGAQKNLQWYPSVKDMRNNRKVNRFLQANSFVQALTLGECGPCIEQIANWRDRSTAEILCALDYTVE